MSIYDFIDEDKSEKPSKSRGCGCLSGLIFLAGILIGAALMVIWNPIERLRPSLAGEDPGWTQTAIRGESTETSPIATSTVMPTPRPTRTVQPTPTKTATKEAGMGTPPTGEIAYVAQRDSPIAMQNPFHQGANCDWMGVGGQALDKEGTPMAGLFTKLGGDIDGQTLDPPLLGMTGTATQYGAAGYELTIAGKPLASNRTLWIQLFDAEMHPLSERISFDTFADCERNLILINFVQQ
jgi:hypothetical protein